MIHKSTASQDILPYVNGQILSSKLPGRVLPGRPIEAGFCLPEAVDFIIFFGFAVTSANRLLLLNYSEA